MMKFFQDNKPPLVWDPAVNKVTITFKAGEFETEDPALADLLIKNGYRFNGALPQPEPVPVKEPVKEDPEPEPEPDPEPEKKEEPKRAKPKMVRKKK